MFNKLKDISKNTIVMVLCQLSVFAVMLILNSICPYISDDWHFKFTWTYFLPTDNPSLAHTIEDAVISAKNYYAMSGGRVICHFIGFIFSLFPDRAIFNITNSGMFALLCLLLHKICTFSTGKANNGIKIYGAIILLMFTSVPVFGDSCLWLSGSVNYLWSVVLLLFCVYWIISKWEKAKRSSLLMMLPAIMLSAATNETTGGILLIVLFLTFITSDKKRILSFAAYCVSIIPSICLVVMSSGNDVRRMHNMNKTAPDIQKILELAKTYFSFLWQVYGVFMIIIVFVLLYELESGKQLKGIIRKNVFFVSSVASAEALSLTGIVTLRPIFFSSILFIPALITALSDLRKIDGQDKEALIKTIIDVFLFASASFVWITGFWSGLVFVALALGLRLYVNRVESDLRIKVSEKAAKTFQKIQVNSKKIVSITVAGFMLYAASNFVNYFQWVKDFNEYQYCLAEKAKEGDFEGAFVLAQEQENSVDVEKYGMFSPTESMTDFGYAASWICAYYSVDDSDDFIKLQDYIDDYF